MTADVLEFLCKSEKGLCLSQFFSLFCSELIQSTHLELNEAILKILFWKDCVVVSSHVGVSFSDLFVSEYFPFFTITFLFFC